YVLDGEMELVPVGVIGELYIGGAGVGRGYRGRAELTAERFVPDEYGNRPGERLYRTGDLVRWKEDGELEDVGRRDHQVKIRGYRIEAGEVESVLNGHEGVQECVVVVGESGGEKRLLGYAGVKKGSGTQGEQLRGYLEERLPGYMVPAEVVVLEQL